MVFNFVRRLFSVGDGNDSGSTPEEAFMGLRSMVLGVAPEELGITAENFPHKVYGMLFETGLGGDASYTLVVIADGTTSLYFSSGGGFIGAGENETVQQTSVNLLSAAQQFQAGAKKVSSTPLPTEGEVTFYFLTLDGIYGYSASEERLGKKEDGFSSLFFAAHDVITEIRKMDEARS